MRYGVVASIVIGAAFGARAAEPDRDRMWKEDQQDRVYLAPGFQFGARSQQLTLTVALSTVANGSHPEHHTPYVDSLSFGGRVDLVGGEWSPAAVHGLLFLSRTFWAGFSWPQGFEVAGGYGGGGGRGYGIGQLSYIIGIASRIEANATWQATLGSSSPRPPWFSTWLVGLRYGFDVAQPRKRAVTIERQ